MKKGFLLFLSFILSFSCFSQQAEIDSVTTLEEVLIKAFEQGRKPADIASSVHILHQTNADRYSKMSLVAGFNTAPGVRMEERSPGSYRINIRGSSLRSPFGVRNIKVYWNDIPVTDAGGNTYFNQFAFNNFSRIEIFKGPAGSMYGAGTGGLVLLHSLEPWQRGISLEYITGSYSLHNVLASVRFGKQENKNQLTYAHNQSDGYRVQSNMRRDNLSWVSQMKLFPKHELTAAILFTDMYYQTPGALTLSGYIANPKAARPAAGGFPSAVNAHAAIYQKNFLAGFTNKWEICNSFSNSTTLYGSFAEIKNPAIRNYERRNEPGFGGRSFFSWTPESKNLKWHLIAGSEFQQAYFNTQVFKNKNGNPDTLQTNDDIHYGNFNIFFQANARIKESWIINTGISFNKTKVEFTRLSNYPVLHQNRTYRNEICPRVAIRKKFADKYYAGGSISRGYSPPTIAELLPSTSIISTDLEAEYGWNYELNLGAFLLKRKLELELTAFHFNLNNALVQRRDVSGADYFINAGDIKQRGIELWARYVTAPGKIIKRFSAEGGYSNMHFRYSSFIKGTDNFSGKTAPSVPSNTISLLADLDLKPGIYLQTTLYSASSIFLNDANTSKASDYQLLGCRLGWKGSIGKKKSLRLNIYAGADNLLDEKYSLGNDINAAAARYYNAAPARNYYAGISFQSSPLHLQ